MNGVPLRVRVRVMRITRAGSSSPRARRSSPLASARRDVASRLSGITASAGIVEQVEEAEEDVRRRVLDHERAPSLPAQHQPLGGQLADGLAGRALAHAELGGDLELVGDELARLPFARADALDQAFAHLGIERPGIVVVGQAHGARTGCRNRRLDYGSYLI